MISRKRLSAKGYREYQNQMPELFPEKFKEGSRVQTVTFQVTDACNLACKYCYQINKGKRRMSFETAKRFIDYLLSSTPENNSYINSKQAPAIILEFIGGEPFLEVELITQIIEYWTKRCIELHHPWLYFHRFSICSNGVLYFSKPVQDLLRRYGDKISFSITIDGNKELHDSCRIFPDGKPSYDIAVAGAKDYINRGGFMGSKITIAPENLKYLSTAINHMYDLGYRVIHANCVYEADWSNKQATIFYYELKKLADFFLNKEDYQDIQCTLFEDYNFKPMNETENNNWCGGTGAMLSCDPDGNLFPCIRYMESSLGHFRKPLIIGDVWGGIGYTQEQKDLIEDMKKVTRRSQSTDECFYCPIASGCAWCSGWNYQKTGSYDKRVTTICPMHKARALANIYYWNKYYKQTNINKKFEIHIPESWALEIIDKKEWDQLVNS